MANFYMGNPRPLISRKGFSADPICLSGRAPRISGGIGRDRIGALSGLSSPFRGSNAIDRSLGRSASFAQRPYQKDGAQGSEDGSSPRRPPLILSGVRGPYLGIQILGIMLVGFGFACGVVRGLIWALDDPNRNRRRFGWLMAALCAPLCLTFYGWAWLGHPLAVWGLR